MGARRVYNIQGHDDKKEAWHKVESRKHFKEKNEMFLSTVFMAKIPEKASSRHIWDFVLKEGGVNIRLIRDIILPKRRDEKGNKFGFIRIKGFSEADEQVKRLKLVKFLGRNMNLIMLGDKKVGYGKSGNSVNRDKEKKFSFEKSNGKRIKQKGVDNEKRVAFGGEGNGRKAAYSGEKREYNFKAVPDKDFGNKLWKSLIGFFRNQMSGIILKEVLKELGIVDILVREISCWNFVLQFRDDDYLKKFNKEQVKFWLHG